VYSRTWVCGGIDAIKKQENDEKTQIISDAACPTGIPPKLRSQFLGYIQTFLPQKIKKMLFLAKKFVYVGFL